MVSISPIINGIGRVIKASPYIVLGEGQSVFQNSLQRSVRGVKINGKYQGGKGYSDLWGHMKNAFKDVETAKSNIKGGFWNATMDSLKNIPSEFSSAWKGSSGFMGRFGSIAGVIGKRLPLLFGAWMVYDEVKNLWGAAKDGKLNATEVAKSGSKLICATLGAAIGQALCPIPLVGAFLGFPAGQWVAERIFGKSYVEEKEEILAQANGGKTAQPGTTFDTGSTNPFAQPGGYNWADMMMAQQLQQAYMQNPNMFIPQYPYMQAGGQNGFIG